MPRSRRRAVSPLVALVPWIALVGCASDPAAPDAPPAETTGTAPTAPAAERDREAERPAWALALHGGAGTIPRDIGEELARSYREALERALRAGSDRLEQGARALDVVELVVLALEEDELFNAGRGAVLARDGTHELDAAIMDGATLEAGAVAAVRTVRNPVRLARRVMEATPHILLVGPGAEAFAAREGLETVDNGWFTTPRRREALDELLARETPAAAGGGTVGAVALDREGHLAAATSTGGLTGKLPGRVGDTPLIGAGTFADDRACAVSATGRGEEFIRRTVAADVCARVRHGGQSLDEAVAGVIDGGLAPGDGGLIAIDPAGTIVMRFNTTGMYRGAADSRGHFEVGIW